MAQRWALPFRLAVSAGIVAALLYHYDFSDIVAHLRVIDAGYAITALSVIAAQYLLSWMRWHYILRRHETGVDAAYSFSIFGIGALANLVLITSLAGMSVRGLLLAREKIGLNRIVGVLLVERVAAFCGMILCVMLGLIISHRYLYNQFSEMAGLGPSYSLTMVAALGVGVLLAILWRQKFVKRVLNELKKSFLSWNNIALLVVTSSAIIFLGFLGMIFLAKGMQIEIDLLFFVTLMPVIAFLVSLPISVGGWGVREGMMILGLGAFGVKAEMALVLSVAYGFAGVLVSCLFGSIAVVWYMVKWRNRMSPVLGTDAN